MKITGLELENWMGIPRLSLKFNSGINILYGRNEIGKSSVIEAIEKAILGDAGSKGKEYKPLMPWGTKVKAKVQLFFTANDGKEYRLMKSFPGGGAELYKQGVQLTDDPRKTQEQLYKILDISDKTSNLFKLLFINQGQSLEIFNQKSKENPLDDNTKSYIKDVIKETAFKGLQEFKDYLLAQLNSTLTAKGKVKSSSDYSKLLEQEKELAVVLRELEQKEVGFLEKIDEIKKADQAIGHNKKEIKVAEQYLETLNKKKNRFHQLEKKQLAYLPIKNDYDTFSKRSGELQELRSRLPILTATRQQQLQQLQTRFQELETARIKIEAAIKRMKHKKQEGEAIQQATNKFKALESDHRDMLKLQDQIKQLRAELPALFAANRSELQGQLEEVTGTMAEAEKKRKELAAIKSRIKETPKITQKDIKALKKLESTISRKEDQMADSREQLQLSFRMTPGPGKEIPYTLKTDQGATQEGFTRQPLDVSGFQKLEFAYPGHFDLHVAGNLGDIDFEEVRKEIETLGGQLSDTLANFGVETIEALEKKAADVQELKTQRQIIQAAYEQFETTSTLKERLKALQAQLHVLSQEIQKYCTEIPPNADETGLGIRDRLTQAKTKIDDCTSRLADLLAQRQCTAAELENLFKQQEANLNRQRQTYSQLEPRQLESITEKHLDKEARRLKDIEAQSAILKNERDLLETITPLPPQSDEDKNQALLSGLSSQQLRDDMLQSMKSIREKEAQNQELLAGQSLEQFNMNYFRRKDEIDTMEKELKALAPVQFTTEKSIDREIPRVMETHDKNIAERRENENLRQRLIGETSDFSRVAEEKTEKQYEYRQLLDKINGHISIISSLKLLNVFVDQERENAQQEVFKPLQQRVEDTFSALVGEERYRVGIDNDLKLNVAGKASTGDFKEEIEAFLSFGTREQLSFLFRLAIASQLSAKEAGVMVLDDSFVNTDMQRLPDLLNLLTERSSDLQFLIFTCRPGDYLENQSISTADHFHTINLEKILEAESLVSINSQQGD